MFGSTAYVHVPKDERGKLVTQRSRNAPYWVMGACRKDTEYLILTLKKVLYSRNVKFDEQERGRVRPSVEEEEPAQRPLILDFVDAPESDHEGDVEDDVREESPVDRNNNLPTTAEPPLR